MKTQTGFETRLPRNCKRRVATPHALGSGPEKAARTRRRRSTCSSPSTGSGRRAAPVQRASVPGRHLFRAPLARSHRLRRLRRGVDGPAPLRTRQHHAAHPGLYPNVARAFAQGLEPAAARRQSYLEPVGGSFARIGELRQAVCTPSASCRECVGPLCREPLRRALHDRLSLRSTGAERVRRLSRAVPTMTTVADRVARAGPFRVRPAIRSTREAGRARVRPRRQGREDGNDVDRQS